MRLDGAKNYVKASELNGGEEVVFISAGEWVESRKYTYPDGNPKQQFVIKVNINGEEKDMSLNKTNRDIMIDAFGNETDSWLGTSAIVTKVKVMVSGKLMDTLVLEPAKGSVSPSESASQPAEVDLEAYLSEGEDEIPF